MSPKQKVTAKQAAWLLQQHRNALAKERDALRDLRLEITDQEENADRALEALDDAISVLSETL